MHGGFRALNQMEVVMKWIHLKRSVVGAAVGVALAVGGIQGWSSLPPAARADINSTPAAVSTAIPTQTLPDFAALAERYGPAVVNISVTRSLSAATEMPQFRGFSEDHPFFEFFRRFQIPRPGGGVPQQGLGSGFIVSTDGTVITNAHVVADVEHVTVKLTDRREFAAKVVGTDPQTDVAVLRIEADNLPTVKLGDAKSVRVGDWVVAIGSPYGFENSVTSGIVSATSRSLPDGTYVPFIQTDVAVNPGNSGGPLFNMKGEVIGINSQIYSRTGGYQGLSFAIPMDVAADVMDQLVKYGKVSRGRIGVTIQQVNQSLADSFGLDQPKGALVSSVEPGGPAAKAGVEPGDVILGVNGHAISTSSELPPYVAALKPGSKAALEVWRNGAKRTLSLTVVELPTAKVAARTDANSGPGGKLGLAVRPLEPEERKQAGVDGGLIVEQASGPAAKAGIQPGDVVLALNGTPVKNADELRRLVERNGGSTVALLIKRNDARIFVPVKVG